MPDEGVPSFTYTALALRQQPDALPMYLVMASAPDLLQWADVPNARADYMAGYQRVYDEDRAGSITDFLLADPKNIVPGAIIVTADAAATSIAATDDPNVVLITVNVEDRSFEDRLGLIYQHFSERLSESERESIDSDSFELDPEEFDDDETPEDAGIPDSYVATLTAELKLAIEDIQSLPEPRRKAIEQYVTSVSKPGLIIDGQHRVYGAKNVSSHDVVLPVILLPGLPMEEQVFHFYVLNNKAKPLSPTELRRTISTSLSNGEIDSLWTRFENAGIDPKATRWTFKINTAPASPFKDLIDFGLGGSGFIKENVAYQLVSKFVNMPRKYRSLYGDLPAWQQKTDDRLDYFYVFWTAIKERYSEAWEAGVAAGGGSQLHQIFYKASMLVLQDLLLDFLVQLMNVRRVEGKSSVFADFDELSQYITASLADLPPQFFTMEWQVKQIDTSEGRSFLRDQMQKAKDNQGKFLGNQQLFKRT